MKRPKVKNPKRLVRWSRVDPWRLSLWIRGEGGKMTLEQLRRCIPHTPEPKEPDERGAEAR